MAKPANREKRKKAALQVILRAMKEGQKLKNINVIKRLLAEESEMMDYTDEYFGALTSEDLASLLCEAWDCMATSSEAGGSPPPPVPIAPPTSEGPGLFHIVGPHTTIGPGNALTPPPSQQESDGCKDLGPSNSDVEGESVEKRCTEDVPDFDDDVSEPLPWKPI
jgi:hypothetical protein